MTSTPAKRIRVTSRVAERISPTVVAAALGAEPTRRSAKLTQFTVVALQAREWTHLIRLWSTDALTAAKRTKQMFGGKVRIEAVLQGFVETIVYDEGTYDAWVGKDGHETSSTIGARMPTDLNARKKP